MADWYEDKILTFNTQGVSSDNAKKVWMNRPNDGVTVEFRYILQRGSKFSIYEETEPELDTRIAGPYPTLDAAKITYLLLFGDS